jgi:uncharacterized protein (TIGR02145 family)
MKTKINFWIISTLFCISSLFALLNCKKDEVPKYIRVHTLEVSEIMHNSATVAGEILSVGGAIITTRGVCWSTNPNPTIADSKTNEGSEIGEFSSKMTDLAENTKYYVRAYATNSEGTIYGIETIFTTSYELNAGIIFNPNITYGTMTDIDGNVYKTVTIGTQIWMAENLKVTQYNDGTPISSNFGEYCSYDNNDSYVNNYGRLYDRFAVMSSKLSPTGWHIPSNSEWTTLINYLGGESVAGCKLKESGRRHWINNVITNESNESGFTALPGGFTDWGFGGINRYCFLWSTTTTYSNQSTMACYLIMTEYNEALIEHNKLLQQFLGSVRCIKD